MRLFRRSLLCLVVGVTAFLAAGWGFRPKANWRTSLAGLVRDEDPRRLLFAALINPDNPSHLVWVQSGFRERLIALDARTGASIGTLRLGRDDEQPFVLEDGDIITQQSIFPLYRLYGGPGGTLTTTRACDNGCKLAPEGAMAFGAIRSFDNTVVRFADLRSGRVEEFVLAPAPGPLVAAHSRDGVRWAIARPGVLEVRDVRANRLLGSAELPIEHFGSISIGRGTFDDGGEFVTFHLDMKPWEFNLRTGVAGPRRDPPNAVPRRAGAYTLNPPGPNDQASVRPVEGPQRRRKCLALDYSSSVAWLTVEGEDFAFGTWRKVPFPVIVKRHHMGIIEGFEARAVPNSEAVVIRSYGTPPIDDVPAWARGFVPASWKSWFETPINRRWLDVTSGSSYGMASGDGPMLVHPDALLVATKDEGGSPIVESWPLPPRDPKWPALGIAIVCAAATWWWCACRYRRRTRLASARVA